MDFSACEGENRFRRTVNAETQRLNGLCDRWNIIKTELNLDDESRMEDIQGQIDTAIGQAQLLITPQTTASPSQTLPLRALTPFTCTLTCQHPLQCQRLDYHRTPGGGW